MSYILLNFITCVSDKLIAGVYQNNATYSVRVTCNTTGVRLRRERFLVKLYPA